MAPRTLSTHCPLCGERVGIFTVASGDAVRIALTEQCACRFGDRSRIGTGRTTHAASRTALELVEIKGHIPNSNR